MNEVSYKSGCLCGAVQLKLTGEPFSMAYCHCESCRLWFGSPLHAGSLWREEKVVVEKGSELLETFKRTEDSGSHRKFCRSCGTPVLVDHPTVNMVDVPAVSIRGLTFEPLLHSHYPERVLSISDGLPKYKDFQPEVGGSAETVGE